MQDVQDSDNLLGDTAEQDLSSLMPLIEEKVSTFDPEVSVSLKKELWITKKAKEIPNDFKKAVLKKLENNDNIYAVFKEAAAETAFELERNMLINPFSYVDNFTEEKWNPKKVETITLNNVNELSEDDIACPIVDVVREMIEDLTSMEQMKIDLLEKSLSIFLSKREINSLNDLSRAVTFSVVSLSPQLQMPVQMSFMKAYDDFKRTLTNS